MPHEFYEIVIDPPLTISGDGSSLWAPKYDQTSRGDFEVNRAELQYLDFGDDGFVTGCWHLQLFGPGTEWYHYTDRLIEREVNAKLALVLLARGLRLKSCGWSEQGMQPDKGWDFDAEVEVVDQAKAFGCDAPSASSEYIQKGD